MEITNFSEIKINTFLKYIGNKENNDKMVTDYDNMEYLYLFINKICFIKSKYEEDNGCILETQFFHSNINKPIELRLSYNFPYIRIEPVFKEINFISLKSLLNKKKYNRIKSYLEVLKTNPHPFNLLSIEVIKHICNFIMNI